MLPVIWELRLRLMIHGDYIILNVDNINNSHKIGNCCCSVGYIVYCGKTGDIRFRQYKN